MGRRRVLALVLVAGLVASACTADDSAGDPASTAAPVAGTEGDAGASGGSEGVGVDELDPCGTSDHPCSLADVPTEVAERTEELATELGERVQVPDDVDDALAWLRGHDDVVFAEAGDEAIRFRVRGGRGQWLFHRTLASTITAAGGPAPGGEAPAAMPPANAADVISAGGTTRPAPDPQLAPLLAQADTSSANQDQFKKALLLSPFRWQWQLEGYDDGIDDIRSVLEARDYVESIDVVVDAIEPGASPPRMASGGLGLASFTSWQDYDYVHLLTHGGAIRKDGRTLTVVMTPWSEGLLEAARTGAEVSGDAERIADFDAVGAESARVRVTARAREIPEDLGPGLTRTEYATLEQQQVPPDERQLSTEIGDFIVLPSTYFRTVYPNGVDDVIIVISACSSAAGDDNDLLNALQGSNMAAAGWSTTMSLSAAAAAATMLARALVQVDEDIEDDSGLTIGAARDRLEEFLRDLSGSPPPPEACSDPHSAEVEAACILSRYGSPLDIINDVPVDAVTGAQFEIVGDDFVRAREVVYLFDRDGEELLEGIFGDDYLPVLGAPNDGKPDEIMATIRVDGLDEDTDPAEVQLRVEVDGQELAVAKPLDREVGDGVWEVDARLPLGRDHEAGEVLTVEVVAVFPEGGESRWAYEDLGVCGVTEGGLPMPFALPPGAEYVGDAYYPPDGDRWLVPSIEAAEAFMQVAVEEHPDHQSLGNQEALLVDDAVFRGIGVVGRCFGLGGGVGFSDFDEQPSSMVVFDLEGRTFADIVARTAP